MFKRTKLNAAIVSAMAASVGAVPAHAAIEEVVVTATKREASTQDIPVAVQALGQQSLTDLGVTNFEEYLIFAPNVTAGGSGPGQNTIYIRGVASTTPTLTTAGVAGLAPNVALYLDEQPLSQPGRNLDIYAADMSRIEVLAGPQGTLFGASSQAGTVRLITNKPDPSGTFGRVKLGTSFMEEGEMSTNVEAMVNFPVTDRLTLRGVVYVDDKGGYIDNVAGTRDASESARFRPQGTVRANGVPVSGVREGFQAADDLTNVNFLEAGNTGLVEDDFNDTTYSGARLSGLFDINEDWSLLVSHTRQGVDSDGVFFSDPTLDDYEIQRFEQDRLSDDFHNTAWTLDGRIGELEVLYTGAYTDRETDQRVDYTDYLFVGQYLPYYICDYTVSYPGAGGPAGTCQAPNLYVKSTTETEVQTHELRVSTAEDRPIRATVGAFYMDLELREKNDFTYPGSTSAIAANGNVGFGPNFSAQPSSATDPSQWPGGVIFRNDVIRTDEQKGVFGEATWDFTSDLSVTVGARWYDVEVDLVGSAAGSFGNFGATVDNNAGNNLDQLFSAPNPDTASTDGYIGKISLSWTPTENLLFYGTWSEGFRPGLLNRPGGAAGPGGYTVPYAIDTDEVTNTEFGWKLDLLDGTLRLNGAAFYVDIENLQTNIFDPSITNLFFSDNAADAEVTGVEGEFIWMPDAMPGLTVSGAFSFLDSEVTDVLVPTQDVVEGDSLAFAPEFQGNVRARYTWPLSNGMRAHVMPWVSYSDESYSDIVTINRDKMDSWMLAGFTAGVSSDRWTAELFVDNLFDEQAELARSFNYDRQRVTYARPREVGVRVNWDF